jgi:RNA recognition motif-containing protein
VARAHNTPSTKEKHVMAVRLFIGNLPHDVTEAELRAHFAAVGPLVSLALPTDRDTGRPRGFAFVEFSAQADAEEAMRRLNNQAFRDCREPPRSPWCSGTVSRWETPPSMGGMSGSPPGIPESPG